MKDSKSHYPWKVSRIFLVIGRRNSSVKCHSKMKPCKEEKAKRMFWGFNHSCVKTRAIFELLQFGQYWKTKLFFWTKLLSCYTWTTTLVLEYCSKVWIDWQKFNNCRCDNVNNNSNITINNTITVTISNNVTKSSYFLMNEKC